MDAGYGKLEANFVKSPLRTASSANLLGTPPMREYLTKGMPTQAILSVLAGFVHMIARNDLITVETVVGSQITAPSDFQFAKTTNKLLEAATGCRVVSVKEGTRYRAKDIVADVAIHSGWDSEFGLIQEEVTLDTDTVETTESKTEESEAKSQENPAPGPESEPGCLSGGPSSATACRFRSR